MCKAAEWYLKLVDWIDRHKTTACMIAGFWVAYWMGEKFDSWNDKMLAVMHEQSAAQMVSIHAPVRVRPENNNTLTFNY